MGGIEFLSEISSVPGARRTSVGGFEQGAFGGGGGGGEAGYVLVVAIRPWAARPVPLAMPWSASFASGVRFALLWTRQACEACEVFSLEHWGPWVSVWGLAFYEDDRRQ